MLNLMVNYDILEHFHNGKNMASVILDQINSGFYDKFLPFITSGIVVDCGANIGLFSLFAAKYASKVVAVEPTKAHIKVFKSLVNSNSVSNIVINECALSNSDGELNFYENENNSTMNSLLPYGAGSTLSYKVPAFSLKSIKKVNNIDKINFVKIDIEGSEKYLLESDEFYEELNKVDSFFIEIHDTEKIGDIDNLHKIQYEWKYIIKVMCNNFPNITLLGHDGLWGVNVNSTRR